MFKFSIVSLFLFASVGCQHHPALREAHLVESKAQVGHNLSASRFSDIYFAAQPGDLDWEKLKSQGFRHVVNLRESSEYDEGKERQLVEDSQLNYTQIPITKTETLTPKTVNLVTQAVMQYREQGKTLIHCGTQQRAAYWAGAHFYLDHNYSPEEAMAMARALGLTHKELSEKLQSFISSN
jgi:protein tyrosine phosphatase (PTP) superfamily phosphohydrolase (DUF442 family)